MIATSDYQKATTMAARTPKWVRLMQAVPIGHMIAALVTLPRPCIRLHTGTKPHATPAPSTHGITPSHYCWTAKLSSSLRTSMALAPVPLSASSTPGLPPSLSPTPQPANSHSSCTSHGHTCMFPWFTRELLPIDLHWVLLATP